ncbi:integumentary mucin C.1-like, partial [Penaeus japonicus]|uniref:integumentary mucin C.1-like n=1 Tax=Penaeus japonicus TaxID=27405 RepID=UPI001C70EB59
GVPQESQRLLIIHPTTGARCLLNGEDLTVDNSRLFVSCYADKDRAGREISAMATDAVALARSIQFPTKYLLPPTVPQAEQPIRRLPRSYPNPLTISPTTHTTSLTHDATTVPTDVDWTHTSSQTISTRSTEDAVTSHAGHSDTGNVTVSYDFPTTTLSSNVDTQTDAIANSTAGVGVTVSMITDDTMASTITDVNTSMVRDDESSTMTDGTTTSTTTDDTTTSTITDDTTTSTITDDTTSTITDDTPTSTITDDTTTSTITDGTTTYAITDDTTTSTITDDTTY